MKRVDPTVPETPDSVTSEFPPLCVMLRDGRGVTLRALRPGDHDAVQTALEGLSADARYSRFMGAVKVTPDLVERAVRLADRDLALAAVAGEGPAEEIVGGARYLCSEDGESCEFAVTLADSWRGAGLASTLMRTLIEVARKHGLKRMDGYVLAANRPMLDLARRLGFTVGASEMGRSVRLARLDLSRAEGGGT